MDVLVSVDDKRRPGGTEGWLQGYGEETGLVAAGVRWGGGARGHQKGVKREAENTVITHPGLFLSGPLAAGGRDQWGFVTLSRVIQWWSGPFLYPTLTQPSSHKTFKRERNSLPCSLSLSLSPFSVFKKTQSGREEKE